MEVLIVGGSGSGKSAYAEERTQELGKSAKGRMIYIATMEPYDEESHRRIARHRQMRKDKHFITVECYTHLEELILEKTDTVLLECMSNLMANERYSPSGRKEQAAQWVSQGVAHIAAQVANLVIVGNNVFEDGEDYDASTLEYIREMAQVQRQIAREAQEVVEVVCGIPIFVKKQEEHTA